MATRTVLQKISAGRTVHPSRTKADFLAEINCCKMIIEDFSKFCCSELIRSEFSSIGTQIIQQRNHTDGGYSWQQCKIHGKICVGADHATKVKSLNSAQYLARRRFAAAFSFLLFASSRYLNTVLAHPYIGQHKLTSDFLTSPDVSYIDLKQLLILRYLETVCWI